MLLKKITLTPGEAELFILALKTAKKDTERHIDTIYGRPGVEYAEARERAIEKVCAISALAKQVEGAEADAFEKIADDLFAIAGGGSQITYDPDTDPVNGGIRFYGTPEQVAKVYAKVKGTGFPATVVPSLRFNEEVFVWSYFPWKGSFHIAWSEDFN